MTQKKVKRPRKKKAPALFAHGAVNPVLLEKTTNEGCILWFGASVYGDDYPVCFLGLENIKELHQWLGDRIAEYETQS